MPPMPRAARPVSGFQPFRTFVVAMLLAFAAIAPGIAPVAANDADDAARTFGQVSAGYTHTCAVLLDGTATCWGNMDAGQSTPPAGTFTQVSANGNLHSCGLHVDGTIECWGGNSDGQASSPQGTFIGVSTGSYHTCAVGTDGRVTCWGKNDDGRATPPDGTFRQVAAGDSHSCGLRTDGTVVCWGNDSAGQVTAPDGIFTSVSAGALHSCGLRPDGTVQCWGSDGDKQTSAPEGTFQQISAGYNHNCAVASNGSAQCWGNDDYRQSTPPAGKFVEVTAGYLHSCGIRPDGTVTCWGWDSEGQSTRIPDGSVFRRSSISAGDAHSCGIADDGTLACWGRDDQGQATSPADPGFTSVSAGTAFSCGLHDDGKAACWGLDDTGQATPPADAFTQVSAGAGFACGLHADSTIACWGDSSAGQAVAPAGSFTQVSAGGDHGCALAVDGTVACWGDDSLGQTDAPEGAFRSVSAGRSHSCAIAADGSVSCWGDDALGQTNAPSGTYREVSAGDTATCAIRDDGTAVCWGDPASSQTTAPSGTFITLSAGGGHTCALLADGIRQCWGTDSDGQASPPIPGAPVLVLPVPDQTATEDAAFEFTFPEGTFVDAESPSLTYTTTRDDGKPLPGWLSLDANTRTFRGTPSDEDVGVVNVKLTATDDVKLAMSSTFAVTVQNTEDPPQVALQLPAQKASEDNAYSFQIPDGTFIDDDLDSGDVLTYTASQDDGTPLPAWLTFDAATRTFSGTPASADVANYVIRVTVTDTSDASVFTAFQLDVSNTNDAPVVAVPIPDQSATEDKAFAFSVPAETFTDADLGDKLTFAATLADGTPLPTWLKFDAGKQTFAGTPANADVGDLAVAVTATDTNGASVSAPFTITIANTNDAPTLAAPIPDQTAVQSSPFTFQVPAGTFADVDSASGDTLTLSANSADGTALPAWLTFDPTTNTFSGTPADGDVGSISVTVTGVDQGGAQITDSFAITVGDANDPPTVVDPIPDQLVSEGEVFALTVDPESFADLDADTGDTLTLSATRDDGSPLPAWLVFDPASRSFLGTPATADVGSLSVSVTATDTAGASVTDTFTVTILAAHNDPTAPTVTLRTRKALSRNNAVQVLIDWSAGAEAANGGRATYRLELRRATATGPGDWKLFANVRARTSINKPLLAGKLQLRIRAALPGKQPGPFVEAAPFTLSLVQDSSNAVSYTGNWSKETRAGASGGSVRRTNQSGASATVTASAESIALAMSTGPTMGTARLCLDAGTPGERCRDLDLSVLPSAERRVVAVYSGLALAEHTVTITATRGQILFDVAIVLE